ARRPGPHGPAHRGARRAPLVRRHRGRGPPRARALRAGAAAALRPARGRDAHRRLGDGPLAAVGAAQPRPAAPARRRPRGGGRVPHRRRAAAQRRGLRAAGAGVARVRLAAVPALRARLPAPQRPAGAHAPAGVVARARRRRRHRPLPAHRPGGGARPRLEPPHPAVDGAGQPRAPARLRPPPAVGLVPRVLRRRLRVGDAAQRHRHEPARRRRHDGHQALQRRRGLHQPHVRPLRRLRVRPAQAAGGRRLPVHRRVLGVDAPAPRPARRQQPHRPRRVVDGPVGRPRRRAGAGGGPRDVL
ncbi:MAG: deoxyribodipyrimidine photolyase-related protein, partial [uncultured Pseudonocardia sp.]